MKKLFSRSIAKIVAILSLTSLVQAAEFHLPLGTPGLQKRNIGGVRQADYEQKLVNTVSVDCEKVKCVDIHDSKQDIELSLYFPTSGQQPTTEEAGQYSGARYNGPRKDDVTDWWVRVFGGDKAVELSNGRGVLVADTAVPMGFDNTNMPVHIIRVNAAGAPVNFEQDFWKAFRTIAADPVGRVLLYRLLIEIRRLDGSGGNGCCGDDTNVIDFDDRNNCRTITIDHSNKGCSFSLKGFIHFDPSRIETFTFIQKVQNNVNLLTTQAEQRDMSIGLFHEMLHWFHFLRNPDKLVNNLNANPENFKYTGRCYYGNISEICIWGGNTNAEEIATILGSPNYNLDYNNLINTEAFLNYNPGLGVSQVTINRQQIYLPNSDLFLKWR